MPSAQLNSVSCHCFPLPLPHPVSTFSLFIYYVEDLQLQIDLWDWFGNTLLPPIRFPPLPRLSLKRLLINAATSSVSCRAKWGVIPKDGGWERARERGREKESNEGKWKTKEKWEASIIQAESYVIHLIRKALLIEVEDERGRKVFFGRGK